MFQNIPPVEAAKEGEKCTPGGASGAIAGAAERGAQGGVLLGPVTAIGGAIEGALGDGNCDPGLICEIQQGNALGQAVTGGTCKKDPNRPPDAKCTCQNPGVAEAGKNGFTCPEIPGKVLYCDASSQACNPSQDTPEGGLSHSSIEGPNGSNPGIAPNQRILGVSCAPKKDGDAICRCVGPQQANPQPGAAPGQPPPASGQAPNGPDGNANSFAGQNTIECVKLPPGRNPSDPNIWNDPALWTSPEKATGTCGSQKDQCNNTPGQIGDNSKFRNFEGFLNEQSAGERIGERIGEAFGADGGGYNIFGVTCRQPAGICTCKNPGKSGTRINGFTCTHFGNKDVDYCNWSYEACVPKPGNRLKTSTNRIFNGADLGEIDCVAVTPSPPPAPPCAEPLDPVTGNCKSFKSTFGTLSTDAGRFIASIFGVLLAMSGGLALLLIIRAGYLIMTSAANPERMKEGREQLIAAIVGLLFIIFSFVILQVIGVDILRIPGLTGT